jgi:hypothetical protein
MGVVLTIEDVRRVERQNRLGASSSSLQLAQLPLKSALRLPFDAQKQSRKSIAEQRVRVIAVRWTSRQFRQFRQALRGRPTLVGRIVGVTVGNTVSPLGSSAAHLVLALVKLGGRACEDKVAALATSASVAFAAATRARGASLGGSELIIEIVRVGHC